MTNKINNTLSSKFNIFGAGFLTWLSRMMPAYIGVKNGQVLGIAQVQRLNQLVMSWAASHKLDMS